MVTGCPGGCFSQGFVIDYGVLSGAISGIRVISRYGGGTGPYLVSRYLIVHNVEEDCAVDG